MLSSNAEPGRPTSGSPLSNAAFQRRSASASASARSAGLAAPNSPATAGFVDEVRGSVLALASGARIAEVVVNGVVVADNGVHTGAHPGQVLRHQT